MEHKEKDKGLDVSHNKKDVRWKKEYVNEKLVVAIVKTIGDI